VELTITVNERNMNKLEMFLDELLSIYGGDFKPNIYQSEMPTLDEVIDELFKIDEKLKGKA
jgi:hypothetical protein